MEGLTFQEEADIQRALYASLHLGRHKAEQKVMVELPPAGEVCSASGDSTAQPPVKRKRGRPRKHPIITTTSTSAQRPSAAVPSCTQPVPFSALSGKYLQTHMEAIPILSMDIVKQHSVLKNRTIRLQCFYNVNPKLKGTEAIELRIIYTYVPIMPNQQHY